jgi:hypothetical protein
LQVDGLRHDHHEASPGRRPVKNSFGPRMIAIALITWILTWGVIAVLIYTQNAEPPYLVDREE